MKAPGPIAAPPVAMASTSDIDQARALKQQGRLAEALTLCRQALVVQPGEIDVLVLTAEICAAQGDRDQAIATYSKVIELRPDQALVFYRRGNLLKDGEQLQAALNDYDRAIALDPRYAYALCNRGFVLGRLGRLEAALDSYDRALAVTPDDVVALSNRADALRELKRPEEALVGYQRAIVARPDHVQSYCNRAVLLTELGRFSEAQTDFDRAISISTGIPDVYFGRGRLMQNLRRFEQALADYERALQLNPNFAAAYFVRGALLQELERWQEALLSHEKALALQPDYAEAHQGRFQALVKLGRQQDSVQACERALSSYERAIIARPDRAQSYGNRAVLLTELGRFAEARADFDRAISISTDIPDLYFGRGRLMQGLRRLDQALADYERALQLNSNFVAAHFARGTVLQELDRWQEALASHDRALALQPDYAGAHQGRSDALMKMGRHVEAIQASERALVSKPDLPFVRGMLQYSRMLICDWEGMDNEVGRLVSGVRNGAKVATPFVLLPISDDPSLHCEAARLWVQDQAPMKHDLPALQRRAVAKKLRIGYFSYDFGDHPVAILTAELFETHDRSRFEISAFSLGPNRPSPMRQRLEKAFDRFLDVSDMSDPDVALLARSHEIDIAVDLSGHTGGSRLGIFSRRAAPIQATWLGYAGTTGADYFDYLIGDQTVVPPEHRPCYSEKIVYLPHCYLPNDSTRVIDDTPTREQAGLPANGFVFCSFNNSYKFTPEVFSSWMRILKQVDHSVLWLPQHNSATAKNLQREAQSRGIDPRRLIFAGRTSLVSQHLARMRLADLMLDTLPYNAHSTAIDALWAGLPLLTRTGTSFAARVATSLLRSIELPELITTSIQQYEEMAVDLATNPTQLAEVKQRLARNRVTTALFDSHSFARGLETAYHRIYERYCSGMPPDHIHVQAVDPATD